MAESTQLTPELKEAIFGDHKSESAPVFIPGVTPTHTTTEAPATPAPSATTEPSAPETPATPAQPEVVDYDVFLEQHFGVKSVDEIKGRLSELETLRKTPPTPAEIKYANEESRRYAEYISAGKEDELRESLNARAQVKALETMNDAEKLKLYIKMNNPLYDPELVDAVYARNYTFNEAQFKDDEGNIKDPLAYRLAKVDALQKQQSDLTTANNFFAQYKSKIELPQIQSAPSVNPEEQQRQQQAIETATRELKDSVSKVTDKEVAFDFKFNDEANKLEVLVNYVPDQDTLKAAKEALLNWDEFMSKNFSKPDGSPDIPKFLQRLSILVDPNKFATENTISTINAERRRFLMQEKNITVPGQRQFIQNAPTEIDVLREKVFGKN